MSARLDYLAGGEAGYTGSSPWGSSTDAAISSILGRIGEGVNRAIDVNVERYLSTRRAPAPAPAPAPTVRTVAGFELPEWAPMAGLAVAGLAVVFLLAKKG